MRFHVPPDPDDNVLDDTGVIARPPNMLDLRQASGSIVFESHGGTFVFEGVSLAEWNYQFDCSGPLPVIQLTLRATALAMYPPGVL